MTGLNIPAKPNGWDLSRSRRGAWLLPDAVFDGDRLRQGMAIRVRGDGLEIAAEAAPGPVWRLPGILAPGFIDLQVNGGGGVLFNGTPTAGGARAIGRAHRTTGTQAILATVITDTPEVMQAAADAVMEAAGEDGIAGIHIEGPHISLARRGTHAAAHVRAFDDRTLACLIRLRAAGIPTMITVAPEVMLPGQIATLAGQGVIVALGHSEAAATQVRAALDEGAATFTHLYNAMSQMGNREPGMVGTAILSGVYASMICDGIHVAPEMLAIAIRARPVADRMIAVTDAMPTVAGPESYDLYGQRIRLESGRLVNAEGALAGAHVTMLASVRFLTARLGQTPESALRMAVTNPARLMGFDRRTRIATLPARDLLLMSGDFSACQFILDAR